MTSRGSWESDAWDWAYSDKPMKLKKTKQKTKVRYQMMAEDILLLRQLSIYFEQNNSEQMAKILSEMAAKYSTPATDLWCLTYEKLKTEQNANTESIGE